MKSFKLSVWLPRFFYIVLLVGLLTSCGAGSLSSLIGCAETGKTNYLPTELNADSYPKLDGLAARDVANVIYQYVVPEGSIVEDRLPLARREALLFLKEETARWTAVEYINMDNQPKVRVMVTFVTPGLLRAILLNKWLHDPSLSGEKSFTSLTNKGLQVFEDRKEWAFFLLIQPDTTQPSKELTISPSLITLHNTRGLPTVVSNSDPFLSIKQNTHQSGLAGFFFYKVGITQGNACVPFISETEETSIMLKTELATIDSRVTGPLIWNIRIPIWADLNKPIYTPRLDLALQPGDDAGENSSNALPVVESFVEADNPNIDYKSLGKYIWWYLAMNDLPHNK